eukprot:CAMPEP_0182478786 /NCGR_PEP_ID=MMETSP1319-20130603/33037_1 /TAXON_ID=172717 /ORGANISM="Bolidomonas pacifica, Strain RCC208" /LENGTH=53 /DNA_ID=CAMNT_0024680153 /DNA_START=181 /DNA_END=338 /DNA_ORIENTATION=-
MRLLLVLLQFLLLPSPHAAHSSAGVHELKRRFGALPPLPAQRSVLPPFKKPAV